VRRRRRGEGESDVVEERGRIEGREVK